MSRLRAGGRELPFKLSGSIDRAIQPLVMGVGKNSAQVFGTALVRRLALDTTGREG